MSNRSSCRVLRTLGMDGFLGFKCGPSCSEKQHNKEIKALIDAIDDLLAYDSETKKVLGDEVPNGILGDDKWWPVVQDKVDDIKFRAGSLQGKHIFGPIGSSDLCDATLRRVSDTADSVGRRVPGAELGQDLGGGLSEKERGDFGFYVRDLASSHGIERGLD